MDVYSFVLQVVRHLHDDATHSVINVVIRLGLKSVLQRSSHGEREDRNLSPYVGGTEEI